MTAIVWDQPGTRIYESGIDRGVLYLSSGVGIPWNGLIAVNETLVGSENNPVYYDGVKFADILIPGDFSASLQAYTYPDEFLEFVGILEIGNGLFAANQHPSRFGLSYRTMIGNEDGVEGYKIHVLYNLSALPSQKSYQTYDTIDHALTFEWNISAIPGEIPGCLPTAHLIFDSRKMSALLLQDIETTLYGDAYNDPSMPGISTLSTFVGSWVIIRIIENFDGTWTATGPDNLITMLDATTFQIIQANAVYLDANTYAVSDTTH